MSILRKFRTLRMLLRSDRGALAEWLNLTGRYEKRASRYLEHVGARRYLVKGHPDECGVNAKKAYDLANLHTLVRRARPKVIIEFGCGFSSIAMAHALKLNADETGKKGRLYVVEAVEQWANNVREKLSELADFAEVRVSEPRALLLNGQVCHVFADLPNVQPDFIYLDGPSPNDITGSVNGLTIGGLKFACSADPLMYEWGLYPGFQMLVDGRYTNVQFLKANLKRRYRVVTSALHDNALFELIS